MSELDAYAISVSIADTMRRGGYPLKDEQQCLLAGCLAVWLDEYAKRKAQPPATASAAVPEGYALAQIDQLPSSKELELLARELRHVCASMYRSANYEDFKQRPEYRASKILEVIAGRLSQLRETNNAICFASRLCD